jgi:Undecaprenyl-phosphate galactose phosphotransferase WbaP
MTTFSRSLAFLLGFSFAFLPAYGPFVSLLFFIESRSAIFRSAWLWGSAALLLSLPLLTYGASGFVVALLQILAPWLIYVASSQLPQLRAYPVHSRALAYGLVSGLAMVVTLGFFNISQFNLAYKTFSQAISWQTYPALYGHTVLTLGGLIAILSQTGRFRLLGLGLSAVGILVSGSREAALAWVFIVLVMLFRETRSWRTRLLEVTFSLAMLALSIGLGSRIGWGNMGFLLDIVPSNSTNMFQGSEIANGDWWDTTWVDVSSSKATLDSQELTVYTVTKKRFDQWLRLQQVVPLETGSTYTLSVWLRTDESTLPGIQGWGKISDSRSFVLDSEWKNGVWQASISGDGQVLKSGILASQGPWRRVYVTFTYQGEKPRLFWYVGFTPDQQDSYRATASFAGLQLEASPEPSAYTPGAATRGLSLGVARLPYWQVAWQGIKEKPLLGWGLASFPGYYQTHADAKGQLRETPAHVHNLYLHILFERGLLGFTGLLLFIAALAVKAFQRRDIPFLTVLTSVLFMNIFDTSLIYGGVLYPLAAIAGWRSQVYLPTKQDANAKQFLVRVSLIAVDTLLVFTSLFLSRQLYSYVGGTAPAVSTTLSYALLIWPALCWREGLYPGYGLTPQQELRKQVSSSFYAGIILAAGTVLFAHDLGMPRSVLIGMILGSMILLPLGRGTCKRLLVSLGLWGKHVAVLGAGEVGKRVVQILIKNPLQGLLPVAIFDDNPQLHHTSISGVPVLGRLSEADTCATDLNLKHAIIALPSLPAEDLIDFVNTRSRNFNVVQFLPDLVSLRSEDVATSNLAGLLALEVRNGLYLPHNRIIKRCLDIIASLLLLGFLCPAFIVIYLWIRFDSSGSPIYGSRRLGWRGNHFSCLKFRTMYQDADSRLTHLLNHSPALREEYLHFHKLQDDPRITRAGYILRRLSLDELPQLFNVLRGDMSLVGPRPYLLDEYGEMTKYADSILEAKPGITGYWQVSARNSVSFQDRLEMETHYVYNWSIWWDIVILANTLTAVFKRQGI